MKTIRAKQLQMFSVRKNIRRLWAYENNHGEFDPGSERTLAARLKHASRTAREKLASLLEWRTGEEHVGNLPLRWG